MKLKERKREIMKRKKVKIWKEKMRKTVEPRKKIRNNTCKIGGARKKREN